MRKTIDVTVEAEGRDKGKVFRITEMDAWRAEEWAWRASSVLARSGAEVPPANLLGHFAVVAAYGLQALLSASFDEARPLLDEMTACVAIVPDPARPDYARADFQEDVEEWPTLLWLRDKVLELHTGFSVAATLSNLRAKAQGAAATSGNPAPSPTSPNQSG